MLYGLKWKGAAYKTNSASRLYTMEKFKKKKKKSLFHTTAESLLQNSFLLVHLLALILLFTPQTLSPPFLHLPLPSTEGLCHLNHRYSALAKSLLFKT